MAMTFQEIMDFSAVNRENFECLRQQLQGNHILPVVGAGLSVPLYPLWSDLLKQIATDSSPNVKKQVYSMLNKAYLETHADAFEEAAGLLLEDWGKPTFCNHLQNIFSPTVLNMPDNQKLLQRMAVFVLPDLFPNNMLLTTNYDHVIEECYRQKGLHLSPQDALHHERITRWLRMSTDHPLLIKLHGDVDEMETTAVLDPQSYDAAYDENSDLVQTLRQSFQQKCILFLGCSLQQDRTMSVLENVSAPGINHFTVFASSPQRQKQQELIRRLGRRRIFPILYPDGKHDCVRIILEELLRQTAPDRYEQLPFKLREAQSQATDSTLARFDPHAKTAALCGRHNELEQLVSFCTDSRSHRSWWMLTGNGGIGKTRLAVELQDEMRYGGWNVHFLNCDRLTLDGDSPVKTTGCGTLLIVDRILGREPLVGAWIENLFRRNIGSCLRILIIDRDNVSQEHICNGAESPALLSEQLFSVFPLTLSPLAKEELLSLIQSYSSPKDFSAEELNDIYDQLLSIDPELKRPLYAMYLAEVWKQSPNAQPKTQWELLQLILDMEFSRCRSYLKSQFYASREVENRLAAYLRIKLAACLAGSLSSDQLVASFSEDWNLMTPEGFGTSLLRDLEGQETFAAPLLPDLLADFFVMKTWQQTPDSFQTLLAYSWECNCLNCARRLSYCALDFPDAMIQVRLLDLPLALESISQKNAYAVLIVNWSKDRDIEFLKTVSARLAMLFAEGQEPTLVYPTAISTTNLCHKLNSFSEKIECVQLLELLKNFPACERYYAICLMDCMKCTADAGSFQQTDDLLWTFLSRLKTLNPLIPYELLARYSAVRLWHYKECGWPSLKQLLQRQKEVLALVDSRNPLCLPLIQIYFLILVELLQGSESQCKQYWTQLSNLYYGNMELYVRRDQIAPPIAFCTVFDFRDKSSELIVRHAWENAIKWAEEGLGPASLTRYAA
ncbi:MAG: SIR2 family protein, partial [Oscillospiraceae bacterium]|nr:SIR2 family protein [Oscillospiraceae bacterium]